MLDKKEELFMEALNNLKEFAIVNGGTVTKDDVNSYFKGMDLNEKQLGMIDGYLMANNIKVDGETSQDNEFLKMMESTKEEKPKREDKLDYSQDVKYIDMYMKDLQRIEKLSDTSKAFLLMNIAEDNDKESLKILSQSYLLDIIDWVEPFRNKGVLASDLIQEGNLAMMAYVGQKRFLENYEWKDKIKEGSTQDLLGVLKKMNLDIKREVEESVAMLIDEQDNSLEVSDKVLDKVNFVNDWALRIKEKLGRKPTPEEVAKEMGVDISVVNEAVQLSGENMESMEIKNFKNTL